MSYISLNLLDVGNDVFFYANVLCSSIVMDDDALNMRNWGYYEQSFKGHLNLQLMSSMAAEQDTKPFLSGHGDPTVVTTNGAYHHRDSLISNSSIPYGGYTRDGWVNQREKFYGMMPTNLTNYGVLPETSSGTHSQQMLQMPEPLRDDNDMGKPEEQQAVKKENGKMKKRHSGNALKMPKPKKPRKPKDPTNSSSVQRSKQPKKSMDVVINGIDMDISGIPIPVCSCTGTPQQCYRWGCGGWQSACCTFQISIYPLPMSTKRRGARIAGRKMSQGAFKKVLEKLAAEGYNFANPIDLRSHWAKHGTNKFVTIR